MSRMSGVMGLAYILILVEPEVELLQESLHPGNHLMGRWGLGEGRLQAQLVVRAIRKAGIRSTVGVMRPGPGLGQGQGQGQGQG